MFHSIYGVACIRILPTVYKCDGKRHRTGYANTTRTTVTQARVHDLQRLKLSSQVLHAVLFEILAGPEKVSSSRNDLRLYRSTSSARTVTCFDAYCALTEARLAVCTSLASWRTQDCGIQTSTFVPGSGRNPVINCILVYFEVKKITNFTV